MASPRGDQYDLANMCCDGGGFSSGGNPGEPSNVVTEATHFEEGSLSLGGVSSEPTNR